MSALVVLRYTPGPSSAAILKSSLMTLLLVSATMAVDNTGTSVRMVVEGLLVDARLVAEVVAVAIVGCSRVIKTVPSSSDDCGKRLLRFLDVLVEPLGSKSSKV